MSKLVKIIIGGAALLASSTSMAEIGGGVLGRTLTMTGNQGNTAEAFQRTFSDGNEMGARVTHRYNEQILVYGDFVKGSGKDVFPDVDAEGDGFGAGFLYFLPGKLEGYDVAFRGSYHTGDISTDKFDYIGENMLLEGASGQVETNALSAELLISPLQPINENGLIWYGGVGVTKQDIDFKIKSANGSAVSGLSNSDSSTDFTASAGLVLPTSFGDVFAAVEYLDGSALAAGIRYNF